MSILDGFAELSGISHNNCSSHCRADHCVLSGRDYCAHPLKGGPQKNDLNRPEIQARYAEACQILNIKNKLEISK